MDKEKVVDKLWESSNHGTERKDVEAAYNAGVSAEHTRAVIVVSSLTKHIEDKQRINQHAPYSARELYKELFSMADDYVDEFDIEVIKRMAKQINEINPEPFGL